MNIQLPLFWSTWLGWARHPDSPHLLAWSMGVIIATIWLTAKVSKGLSMVFLELLKKLEK